MTAEEQRARILWKTLNVPVGCVAHHCILEQKLRDRGHSDKLWDFRNRLVLTREEHERYHAGFAPVWRDQLPDAVWEFALELDGGPGGYFTHWLKVHYEEVEEGVAEGGASSGRAGAGSEAETPIAEAESVAILDGGRIVVGTPSSTSSSRKDER
jgi:hypothetical protein